MRREWLAVMVAGAGLAVTTWAQPVPPPRTELPAAPSTIKPERSLVKRDEAGKIIRLEIPVEEAAARVMDLTEAERARVDRVLAERGEVFDRMLLNSPDLLQQLHDALRSGDEKQMNRVIAGYTRKTERLTDRGRLEDEIRPELRLDHVDEYNRIVAEYRREVLAEAAREAKAGGKELTAQGMANLEIARAFGRELKRSYMRTVGAEGAPLPEVIGELALKPEQQSKIEEAVQAFKSQPVPTAEQKQDLALLVMKELDLEQRMRLAKLMRGES